MRPVLEVPNLEALMRIAVISDIHGDLDSLRHVLGAIDWADCD